MKIPRTLAVFASLWTVLFWSLGVAIPLGSLLASAWGEKGWKSFTDHFMDPAVLFIMQTTLWQASWSTFISGSVGLVLGLAVGAAAAESPAKRFHSKVIILLEILLAIPFGIPTVVVGTAW